MARTTLPPVDDTTPALPSSVSRRNLLRLALAGAGVAATGPALARTGLFDSGDGVVRQDAIPGVISGDAPFAGPSVPKFERDLLIPPTLAPTSTLKATRTARATRTYDLEHRVTTQQILPENFRPPRSGPTTACSRARPSGRHATAR